MRSKDRINSSRNGASKLEDIARLASILASVIDIKVAKTDASFLAVY